LYFHPKKQYRPPEISRDRLNLRLGRPFSHPEYSALLKELLGNLQPAYVNTVGEVPASS